MEIKKINQIIYLFIIYLNTNYKLNNINLKVL